MQRIDVKLPSILNQTVLKQGECYWELHPNKLVQKFVYSCEDAINDEDLSLGYEKRVVDTYSEIHKSYFVGVEVCWQQKSKVYRVELISIAGEGAGFFLFNDKQEAYSVHRKVIDWILNNDK